jgi:hypothetical protein
MRTAADHGFPLTVHVHRSRMRAFVQIVGGVVLGLGLGLAAASGLDPALVFAAYTVGVGVVLLCLCQLLPENPDAAADLHDRSCPPYR